MKKLFNKAHFSDYSAEGIEVKQVLAEPIIIEGFNCFIFKEPDNTEYVEWNITHAESGMRVYLGDYKENKKQCIEEAAKRLKRKPEAVAEGIELIKKYGFEYPLNKTLK